MKNLLRISLFLLLPVLFLTGLFSGPVHIDIRHALDFFSGNNLSEFDKKILWDLRFPRLLTALLAGSALGVCGLMMQTVFRNPLAGPYVLGVNSGASLMVAIVIMVSGGSLSGITGNIGIAASACIGASLVLFLMWLLSLRFKDPVVLLIIGIMISQFTGSLEGLAQYFSSADDLQEYVIWGLGSFGNTTGLRLLILSIVVAAFLIMSFFLSGGLDALLAGSDYARSMGVNSGRIMKSSLLITGVLAGIVTAFCGPIAFIGISVPHIARSICRDNSHRKLLMLCILSGGVLALFCEILSNLSWLAHPIPVNILTSIIGAPVVFMVIIQQKKKRWTQRSY